MIDTIEQQATCKICGRPIVQKNWGPHKREYCDNGACRQAAYRRRKREEQQNVTMAVTMNEQAQQRITELEQELTLSKLNVQAGQEKLSQAGSHIQKLERQVEVQKQRLSQPGPRTTGEEQTIKRIEQYAIDCALAAEKSKARVAELEQEVELLRALQGRRIRGKDRIGLQERLMTSGQACGYKALTIRVSIGQGVDVWRSFAKEASEDMLARAIVAAGS